MICCLIVQIELLGSNTLKHVTCARVRQYVDILLGVVLNPELSLACVHGSHIGAERESFKIL
jgi:hypothetical protein